MPLEMHDVAQQFAEHFGRKPRWVVRAPGRVNLIGEHTDYNDGFVLPLAIDRAVWIALRPRDDRQVVVHSVDYRGRGGFSLDKLVKGNEGWTEYLKGAAWSLQEAGYELTGWEGVLMGDVPLGAGLASSAALEIVTILAFAAVSRFEWDPVTMAKLGQRAENEWIGVKCGIMDQLISAAGQAGHALLIDCRSLEIEPVPFPGETVAVILDTGTRRGLVDSAYNERRAQCESAADFFRVPALRDLDLELFQRLAIDLDDTVGRRAMHVITENERTLQAVDAMRRGEVCALGVLMNKSHASLRDDYEVSSDALNAMVESACDHPACYGARMTGAGFGGCAIAIIRPDETESFVQTVTADYREKTGHTPMVYVTHAANGAEIFEQGRL